MPAPNTLEKILKNNRGEGPSTGRRTGRSSLGKDSLERYKAPIAERPSSRPIKPARQEIATLAYYLFEERGRAHGHDVEDWLAAEAHLCTDEKHCAKQSLTGGGG